MQHVSHRIRFHRQARGPRHQDRVETRCPAPRFPRMQGRHRKPRESRLEHLRLGTGFFPLKRDVSIYQKYYLSTPPTLLDGERIPKDTNGQLDDIPKEWD